MIEFPQEIDVNKTEAKLEEGILEIKAPKLHKEKEKAKKLIIK